MMMPDGRVSLEDIASLVLIIICPIRTNVRQTFFKGKVERNHCHFLQTPVGRMIKGACVRASRVVKRACVGASLVSRVKGVCVGGRVERATAGVCRHNKMMIA